MRPRRVIQDDERLELIRWAKDFAPKGDFGIHLPVSKCLATVSDGYLRSYWCLTRTARNDKSGWDVRTAAHESLFDIRVKIELWLAASVHLALHSGVATPSDLLDGTVFGSSLKQGVSFRLPLSTCRPTRQCAGGCYAHDGLDASISTVVRGVLNGCFARNYEESAPSDRRKAMEVLEPHTRGAVRQAIRERDRAGWKRRPRIRLSHLGEIVVFPDFANALARQVRDTSGGEVVCSVYTRHENARLLDPESVTVNFTLDESSLSRAEWAPPGSKLVLSAWGGRTRDDVDVNYLEHHHLGHTQPTGPGRVCPATRPDTVNKTCDGVRCAFCFTPGGGQRRSVSPKMTKAKGKNPPAQWAGKVAEVDRLLEARYLTPDLGNLPDPTDELFYILLSNKSDPNRYGEVFRSLRAHLGGWGRLRVIPTEKLVTLLEPLGLALQRSARFKEIAEALYQTLGSVSLDPLRGWGVQDALAFLKTLPGVGEKSARCVLMYSLGADVFPIDSHVMRVSVRLGLVPSKWSLSKAQHRLDSGLPSGGAHRLHVNVVAHGRAVCRPTHPNCPECPVETLCPKRGVPTPRRREV